MKSIRGKFGLASLVTTVFLLAGCATNHVVGFVDPAYRAETYDSFITYAAFKDMALEARYERAVCDRIQDAGKQCTTMLAAAPPTRPESAARRQRATGRSGAGATVVIQLASHAQSVAVKKLGDPGPRYRITVFDNRTDDVAARFETVIKPGSDKHAKALSNALANAVVRALKRKNLLIDSAP